MINRDFLTLIGYRVSDKAGDAGHVVLIHGQFIDVADTEADGWTKAYLHYTNAKPSNNWLDQFTPQEQEFITYSRYLADTTPASASNLINEVVAKMARLLDQSYQPPERGIVAE